MLVLPKTATVISLENAEQPVNVLNVQIQAIVRQMRFVTAAVSVNVLPGILG